MWVGLGSSNRDELGGNVNAVHELIDNIMEVGWSDHEVMHATCIACIQGNKTEEPFNQQFVKDQPLAPVHDQDIQYTFLACGHNNYAMRAVLVECRSITENPLVSKNNKLSLEVIRENDERYAQAIDRGISWTVLKKEVRWKYPNVSDIIQAASNVYYYYYHYFPRSLCFS